MSIPTAEWRAIASLVPPSRWAALADRIAGVEHAAAVLGEQLQQTLDGVQDLPAVAEDEQTWWHCETVRTAVERLPAEIERLDALLGELFDEFGPKVPHSAGTGFVQWREGPWPQLVRKTDE